MDTCRFAMLLVSAFVPLLVLVCLNICLWLYAVMSWSHYTCWIWNGGCPTGDIDLCVGVFYILLFAGFHPIVGWSRYLKRVWIYKLLMFQLWILYWYLVSLYGGKTHPCIWLLEWQKCHLQIFSIDLGVWSCFQDFFFKLLHKNVGHYGA